MLNNKNTNNVETHTVLFYHWFSWVYLLFSVGKLYNTVCFIYGNIRIKGIKILKSSMVYFSIYVLV